MRAGGGHRGGEIVEVGEQAETGTDLFTFGEIRPAVPVDIARGESVLQVSGLDVLEDSFGSRQFSLVGRALDASSVALEIVGERQGLKQSVARY